MEMTRTGMQRTMHAEQKRGMEVAGNALPGNVA